MKRLEGRRSPIDFNPGSGEYWGIRNTSDYLSNYGSCMMIKDEVYAE